MTASGGVVGLPSDSIIIPAAVFLLRRAERDIETIGPATVAVLRLYAIAYRDDQQAQAGFDAAALFMSRLLTPRGRAIIERECVKLGRALSDHEIFDLALEVVELPADAATEAAIERELDARLIRD